MGKCKLLPMPMGRGGLTIVELVIATTVIILMGFSAAFITRQITVTSRKAKAVHLAVEMESAFYSALADKDNYSETLASQLRSGILNPILLQSVYMDTSPARDQKVPFISLDGTQLTSVCVNTKRENVTAVTGNCNTASKDWDVVLTARIKLLAAPTSSTPAVYGIGYSVSANPRYGPIKSLGVDSDGVDFPAGAYNQLVLPASMLFRRETVDGRNLMAGRCESTHYFPGGAQDAVVGVFGFNRNTMAPICLLKPMPCDPPTKGFNIAKELILDYTNKVPGTDDVQFKIVCKKNLSCGCKENDYKVQRIDLITLDGSRPGDVCGKCVLRAPDEIDARVPDRWGEEEVTAGVCPSSHYSADLSGVGCAAKPSSARKKGDDPLTLEDENITCANAQPPAQAGDVTAVNDNGTVKCKAKDPISDKCWKVDSVQVKVTADTCVINPADRLRDAYVQ